MKTDQTLRDHVLYVLTTSGAHATFEKAIADVPAEMRGAKIPPTPHTLWRLLEHIRLCQWDILEYCRDPQHESPEFPDGYWPEQDAPPNDAAWDESINSFRADFQDLCDLVADPTVDLLAPLPHAPEHTILREALLVADHNAYHLGQFILLRRLLGVWPEE